MKKIWIVYDMHLYWAENVEWSDQEPSIDEVYASRKSAEEAATKLADTLADIGEGEDYNVEVDKKSDKTIYTFTYPDGSEVEGLLVVVSSLPVVD